MRELLLREAKQKVGLVFGLIRRSQQLMAAALGIAAHAGVVARGEALRSDLPRGGQQRLELHVVIAQRAGQRLERSVSQT